MITGKQIRAARIFLDWDAKDLADKAGVNRETVFNIERGTVQARPSTIKKIVKTFYDAGVEFNGNCGVELRDDTIRKIAGNASYLEVLDDVFMTLRETSGEVLFAFVRNKLSTPEVIESQLRLRRLGIKFRSLIEEGDTYCLFPLNEYRTVPKQFFRNNVLVIYGDKVALFLNQEKRAIIIRDSGLVETQRKMFEIIWNVGSIPTKTTAAKTYE
ncbi:MAG: helix-turn-helix domain-containing protein [Alphaproteobacteria bacterium]|nr:helix-turn-helix domain-containing protein [Alphaproteobacteria bacterium]